MVVVVVGLPLYPPQTKKRQGWTPTLPPAAFFLLGTLTLNPLSLSLSATITMSTTTTSNKEYRDETLTFNGNVVDCKFYSCRVTVQAPFMAIRCEFHKPRVLSATLQDCFLQMEGWSSPLTHHSSQMCYAGPGEVSVSNCSGNNIIRRVVPSSKKYKKKETSPKVVKKPAAKKVFTTPPLPEPTLTHFVTSTGADCYCGEGAICLSGEEGLIGGQKVNLRNQPSGSFPGGRYVWKRKT